MKEERYFFVPNAEDTDALPEEEATHAIRVLRLKESDDICLMDGVGNFYKAEITMASHKRCVYKIHEKIPQTPGWNGHIHIAMAPTKMMERTEWMAEKATELGINEISFLECKNSERRQIRIDRIEKIVLSAMKQSRKAWKPNVNAMSHFNSFIDEHSVGDRYICHCYDEIEKTDLFDELLSLNNDKQQSINKDVTVLIGPEGDFSVNEVEYAIKNGYKSVSLGKARLRTETAALSAVMMAQLLLRK